MQSNIDQRPVSGAAHAIKGKINRIILTWKVFALTIPIILKSNMVITESSHNIDKPSSTWRCLHEHFDISFTLRQCHHGFRANVKLMSKCSYKHQEYWATSTTEWFVLLRCLLFLVYFFSHILHANFCFV